MCGFLCAVTRRPVRDVLPVDRFDPDVLRHRGPDDAGTASMAHAYVRHWRLSIVDLSPNSAQPYGRDGSWLLYNGEIYNYASMARDHGVQVTGDTPLLYELCAAGVERAALAEVRGFYAYLFVSDEGREIRGARDPFGKKPLFYHVDDAAGIAVFASDERAILDVLGRRDIDFDAVSEFLLYKQVFRGASYFSGIRQLAPGASFRFNAREWSMSVDRQWDEYYRMPAQDVFALGAPAVIPADRLERDVHEQLRQSLRLRVPHDVTACVALSGGVDSALLADLIVDGNALRDISRFVTIGFAEAPHDESGRAREIARSLGVADRHVVERFAADELLASLRHCVEQASGPLEHPHYLSYDALSRRASEFAKVLITGEGADELFMGYEHYLTPGASFAFREYLHADDEAAFEASASAAPFAALRRRADVAPLRARALTSRAMAREGELKTHLLTLLARNDKMGMANSVEIRAPFLDRDMLSVALALDERSLIVDGVGKHVLKQLFARRFPRMALQPRKIGFRVPFDEQFEAARHRDEWRDYCALAARALRVECGLSLVSIDAVSPRLGWSLLNIGVFLDVYGYRIG